jgi:hypothetical protein
MVPNDMSRRNGFVFPTEEKMLSDHDMSDQLKDALQTHDDAFQAAAKVPIATLLTLRAVLDQALRGDLSIEEYRQSPAYRAAQMSCHPENRAENPSQETGKQISATG